MNCTYSKSVCALIVFSALGINLLQGQTAKTALHGRVTDPSGASVPGAVVSLRSAAKSEIKRTTDLQGQYTFTDLTPDQYTVTVTRQSFAPAQIEDYSITGDTKLDFQLQVAMETEKVTVKDSNTEVNVDPNSNAAALVLRGKDLEALSDDPDQLESDLQALAGPSAGPNGGQIYIDGFTGGRIPPKSSIREVRVNQNPFSAEFDHIGYGRVEIFTKPGTDKLHGQFMTMFSDNAFNARYPFVTEKPDYQARIFSGQVGGSLNSKTSFSIDAEHRGIDENQIINSTILNQNFQQEPFAEAVAAPQERWHVVPRLDYQLTPKNSLTARYAWSRITNENQGVGGFSLASQAYDSADTEHTIQLTETAVISTSAINETRFQFRRDDITDTPFVTGQPAISVQSAFTTGGVGGLSSTQQNSWEISNMTSKVAGRHTWKFGGRVRISTIDDTSPSNFNGTFSFSGGEFPVYDKGGNPIFTNGEFSDYTKLGDASRYTLTSIQQYRAMQLLMARGLSSSQISTLGYGPSQFSLTGGTPYASVNQTDVGVFILDDWKLRPNFTLSYGLRYENQTNISDNKDFSPRLSFAWGIDGGAKKTAKTVLRGGGGIFYDRVSTALTLAALRNNGVTESRYLVANPDFYPNVPTLDQLGGSIDSSEVLTRMPEALRTPYLLQTGIGVDRQLPRNSTVSLTYTFSRGVHMLRTRDINAPVNGVYPDGNNQSIYQYESTGTMRQNQLIANFRTSFSRAVSLFGFYMLNYAKSDTDGVSSFPANSYDLHPEWSNAAFDVRHRVFLGGSVTAPARITLSPFITASSGSPFNIVTGNDLNGDGIFNDRPAFVTANTPQADIRVTEWGTFNVKPGAGDVIIPRNYGRGPGQWSFNLRLARTWGFGKRTEAASGGGPGMPPGGPGFGGPRGPRGGGRGGPGGMFGDASTGRRYNLTLGIMARNIFNVVNLNSPIGTLLSPNFGKSMGLAGGFGPSSNSSNRQLNLQLRFSF